MNRLKRSNKNMLSMGSVLIFIILSILAFQLPSTKESKPNMEESTETPISDEGNSPLPDPIDQGEDSQVPENQNNPSTVVDLSAVWDGDQVELRWILPTGHNDSSIQLIKTASKPEGKGEVFELSMSDEVFFDKDIMPGMRYYYELEFLSQEAQEFSSIAAVHVPGILTMSFADNQLRVNGKTRSLGNDRSIRPYLFNGTVMVPMKILAQELGADFAPIIENGQENLDTRLLSFRNTEVEFRNGELTAIVNRTPKPLPSMTIIKDGVFYVPLEVVRDFMGFRVFVENEIIRIEKPVEEPALQKGAVKEREVSITKGKEFTITLPNPSKDGRRWFYRLNGENTLKLKKRSNSQDETGMLRNEFLFETIAQGRTQLVFYFFQQGMGESSSEEIRVYNLEIVE